ncbi:hypothetical protein AB6A40_006484 [Gnathostoma spinigerum]|uniref:Uncharacterized protein n=1 Tax=Gnathostoma spinigerum TaxID=75299 RepID=A0ABD6EIH5_9BILA
MRFVKLQVVILDEFRLRLVQISQQLPSPWETPFIQLMNSFWYLSFVLDEWNDMEIFIRLQNQSAMRGVFDSIAEMYRHVWKQRAADLCRSFYQCTSMHLSRYRKVRWFSLDFQKPSDITPSFCPFLLEIRRLLAKVATSIAADSALPIYQALNRKVSEILDEIISENSFSCNGAAQMLFDITSGLIPILNAAYGRSCSGNFDVLDDSKMQENVAALHLLSLPVPTAVLLCSELECSPEEMTPTILKSYNASCISREKALRLFTQRCDVQMYHGNKVHL